MKNVVIIGGGFAGSKVARKLSGNKDFKVTLIDNKEYFEFTPGILRTLVEPEHSKCIQVLHKTYLKNVEFILGNVGGVFDDYVVINKKKISFDYLVITSGSHYGSPIKDRDSILVNRAKNLVKSHEKLKKAKKVHVIGGGLAGVELAAEIICKYPDKKVTLYHSKDRLCNKHSLKTSGYVTKFLVEKGVEIVLDKYGKENKKDEEMTFICTGIKPNFAFLEGSFSEILSDTEFISVNNYLQTYMHPNIFSAGDVADTLGEKMAQNAIKQAEIVADNIVAIENGKQLKSYISKTNPIIISLGKNDGVFEYGKFVWAGFLPGLLKRFVEWMEMRKL
ncbi:MAG: FAD-dependent oxidoreductase [Nanoarchaeota archaeon]